MPEQAKPQLDKFKDLARELEVDEDEAAFEERLRKIAGAKSAKPKAGHWDVAQVPGGFKAVFCPEDEGAGWRESDIFQTLAECEQWLRDMNCRPSDDDRFTWRDA
jgi:hypothetical protein